MEIEATGPLDAEAAQPFSVKTVRYNPAAVSFFLSVSNERVTFIVTLRNSRFRLAP